MDDIIKGNLRNLKGQLREWWGELTDDDIEQIGGNKDQLLGKLQTRYGWNKEQAQAEIDRRMNTFDR